MTNQNLQNIIAKNKELLSQGRWEGAIMALFGGLLYLVLIAIILN